MADRFSTFSHDLWFISAKHHALNCCYPQLVWMVENALSKNLILTSLKLNPSCILHAIEEVVVFSILLLTQNFWRTAR